jgi:hypothetical protein
MPYFILPGSLIRTCTGWICFKLAFRLPNLLRNITSNLESETEFPLSRQQPSNGLNPLADYHHSLLLVWLRRHWGFNLWLLLPDSDECFLYWHHWTHVRPQHQLPYSTHLFSLLLTVCLADSVNTPPNI